MAGSTRAEDQGDGPGAEIASPRVSPAGGAHAAPRDPSPRTTAHDPSDGAAPHDPSARAMSHDSSNRAMPPGSSNRAMPPGSSDRAMPHEAQAGSGSAPALGRNPEVEDAALPPHEPGSMDISAHEETYQRFIGIVIRTVITIFVVLVLLALING